MSSVTLNQCSTKLISRHLTINQGLPAFSRLLLIPSMKAEVKVCTVLAHHNIPIAVSDHLSPLFKDIFPDSQIAKAYSCARTKSACIINGTLAKELQKSLIEVMKSSPFSLTTDESIDSDLNEMDPLTQNI